MYISSIRVCEDRVTNLVAPVVRMLGVSAPDVDTHHSVDVSLLCNEEMQMLRSYKFKVLKKDDQFDQDVLRGYEYVGAHNGKYVWAKCVY